MLPHGLNLVHCLFMHGPQPRNGVYIVNEKKNQKKIL